MSLRFSVIGVEVVLCYTKLDPRKGTKVSRSNNNLSQNFV